MGKHKIIVVGQGGVGKQALRIELSPEECYNALTKEIAKLSYALPNPDDIIRDLYYTARKHCSCFNCKRSPAYCSQYTLCMWDYSRMWRGTKRLPESSAYIFYSCCECKVKFFEFLEKNYPHTPFCIINNWENKQW